MCANAVPSGAQRVRDSIPTSVAYGAVASPNAPAGRLRTLSVFLPEPLQRYHPQCAHRQRGRAESDGTRECTLPG